MNIERELEKFKIELISTKPFFGNALYSLEFKEDSDTENAFTSTGLNIVYNSSLIKKHKLGISRIRYHIIHELYHILLLHRYRIQERNEDIWTIACDMIIEYTVSELIETEFIDLSPRPYYDPSYGLYKNKFIVKDEEKFKKESEESIYNKLYRNYLENDGSIKYSDRVFSLNLEKSGIERHEKLSGIKDREEGQREKSRIENVVSESVIRDKISGTSSKEGLRILGIIEGKRVNWKRYIRRQLQSRFTEDTSFSYPDSRFHWNDMIIPDFSPVEDYLELLIILDLSSSIDRNQINEMLFQLDSLTKQFSLKARILGFSTEVVLDKEFDRENIISNIEKYSFGGTDWNCIADYIDRENIRYRFAITITDGNLNTKPQDMSNHMWIITEGNKMNYRVINKVIEL